MGKWTFVVNLVAAVNDYVWILSPERTWPVAWWQVLLMANTWIAAVAFVNILRERKL